MARIEDLLARDGAAWRHSVDSAVTCGTRPGGDYGIPLPLRAGRRRGRVAVWASVAAIGLVAAVIVAAVAFTNDDRSGHGSNRPASGVIGLPVPGATDPVTAPAPLQHRYPEAKLLSPAQAAGLTSMPWRLVGINPQHTQLEINYIAGGGCTTPRGLYVKQAASYVLIAALGKTDTRPNITCSANLIAGRATVTLAHPLGTRPLLHATVDPAWDNPAYLGHAPSNSARTIGTSQPSVSTTPPSGPITRCTMARLRIQGPLAPTPNMAAGVAFYLRLTNTGATACSLHGWPAVSVLTADRSPAATSVVKVQQSGAWRYRVKEIDLAPGAGAGISFFAGATKLTHSCGPYYLKMSLPGQPGNKTLYDPHNYVGVCPSLHTTLPMSPFHQGRSRP